MKEWVRLWSKPPGWNVTEELVAEVARPTTSEIDAGNPTT